MAKFQINKGFPNPAVKAEVDANSFKKDGDMIVFYDAQNMIKDAFQGSVVYRVTRVESE